MTAKANATIFDKFREQFPGTRELTYLDVAARGLVSRGVRKAVDRYLDHRMLEGADKKWMFQMVEAARTRFATLVGAQVDEISITKNVSEGINSFALALPWQQGDNVVLCSDIEHPANIYPWYNLARQKGITVKTVSPINGRVPLEKMASAIDGRTRVVTVATVSFAPGFRAPVSELSAMCRRTGALLLADAAQTVGVSHTDVNEMGVDGLAVATQKGLLGFYGLGFLYVRKQVAATMQPAYLSRMGLHMEETHEAASGDPAKFEFAAGARRFDVGNYNFAGAIAVAQSMAELLEVGSQSIETRVGTLVQRLVLGLVDAGLPVFGGADCRDRSHIVSIGSSLSEQHDSTGDASLTKLHEALIAEKIRHTIRRGVVRLSLHAYNNEDDVDHVLEVVRNHRNVGIRDASTDARPLKSG